MKRAAVFELVLPLRDSGKSANRWLYESLRGEILEGRLRPGTRLPATRDLARQYGLARGTIVNAFEQLESEGYIEGSVGSGTYVNKVLPDELLQVPPNGSRTPVAPYKRRRRVSDYARRVKLFPNFEIRPSLAFRANMPALDLFPTTLWAQVASRRLRRASANLLLGCGPLGYPPLRDAVATYLSTSRGVKCVADQVVIVSGVQEAVDLATRLLVNPGDRVCMENPGYPGAAIAFKAAGAKVSALCVDGEGMRVQEASMRGARVVYVTPGHQFPLGVTMSVARRLQLLDWAGKSGALILEDDYDSEYRYSGRPVPALQGLDRHGLVLFTGSFSKVLFPSLRVGYLVVPPDLVDYFSATVSVTNRHAPLLEQAVLCDFINEGHFGRHLRRMREVYAQRLSVLLDCAQQDLSGVLEISGVEAGLQISGWLHVGLNAESVAAGAATRGVEVTALSRYRQGAAVREGLQLGFAAVDSREIRRGVRELAITLENELKTLRRKGNRACL
ncbi:MAG: PLP-dependent aminotransferase family protein [Candidatus Sulfotelmatobacter sp.]|jgi:GntR family transcriptional regulator/MocR family aminotransferase